MDGWDEYYECVDRELDRQMERHLHLFSESLDWWLHAEVNWPSRDWEVQLQHLVDHTRYYGLEIHPVSIQSLHDLVEARVNGTGPFESFGPYCWDEPAVATGEPIQLAVAVGLDDGTRTDAEPAMHQEIKLRESDFDRKLTVARGRLDEIAQVLEALGQKLDAAKIKEDVEVETEADIVEVLIWRFNDAMESARDIWLFENLSGDAYERLVGMPRPVSYGLPLYTDDLQSERADRQERRIAQRLRRSNATMDRIVVGMQTVETVGNVAGFFAGGGIVISAVKKGGKWAVVKTIVVAGAAIAAEQGVEQGLRAAGAGDQTIRGVHLAAAVVTLIILRRKSGSNATKPSPGSGPEPPTTPKTTAPSSPKPVEPSAPRGPYNNPSGNLEDAARAARTQPHGPARVPGTARAGSPRAKTYPPIEGTVDRPRTPEHTFLQQTIAEEMQATGDYTRVGMNMNLSKFSGRQHSPDIKPDNIGLTAEGKIDMIEILSPGQKRADLNDKLEKAMNQLPPEMRGEFRVTDPQDAFK